MLSQGILDGFRAEYHGSSHTTQSCIDALVRLLLAGLQIEQATLLSSDGRHGILLVSDNPEPIFIRCGFSSGYHGEGPKGLAKALWLLSHFGIATEEICVSQKLLDRVDSASLRSSDWDLIEAARVVRPKRIYDYMHDGLSPAPRIGELLKNVFPTSLPWSIIDQRLFPIALTLRRDPDRAVFEAYRELEQVVKTRCAFPLEVHGVQVFKKAFRGANAQLVWPDIAESEKEGRAQMFEAGVLAHRNPRAHRTVDGGEERALREFLLVNELFRLESESVPAAHEDA